MLERNITIREIEEKDKASYLNLFNSESFGCIGINSNQKPSIYAEEQVLDSVIRGENIATKILVIEDNNQFVGYTLIEKKNDWLYHIGEFVICKPLRNQGYGSILIERVKSYADIDGCNIDLECLTRAESFFRNHQFTNKDIYFKYSSDRSKRADQFVVYSNLLNLTDYVEILRSIASENPDIIQRCGKPPILTGTLDEWIGIGDEPLMTGESYTGIRAEIIEDAIKECLLGTEDFEESYDWDKIDYDLIRQTIEEKLGKRGLSIENFAFNNDNLALYNATQQEREEYDLGRKQEKMKSRLELSDEKQIIQNQLQEKNAYRKLKILEQIGFLPEELKQGTDAINSRYGFLSDIMP